MTPYHRKVVKALKQLGLTDAATKIASFHNIPQGATLSEGLGQLPYADWLQPAYNALVKAEERNKIALAILAPHAPLKLEDLNFKPANNENLLTLYTSKVKKSKQNEALYEIFSKLVKPTLTPAQPVQLINIYDTYVTKDGRPARVLCVDLKHPDWPVVAAIPGVPALQGDNLDMLYTYTKEGYYRGHKDDNRNLVLVAK